MAKYVVIFRAEVASFDQAYFDSAAALRDLAIREYGCVGFHSCTQGQQEIAVSYWNSLDDVRRWKDNAQHRDAQGQGRANWYSSYQVEVAEIVRGYGSKPHA